jgi:hypothetical protein
MLLSSSLLVACSGDDGDGNGNPPPPSTARALWVVPDSPTPLTAEQAVAFDAGTLYYNAHTQANPSGEIRGQLDRGGSVRFATLSGAQETPAVTTAGYGAGVLVVDQATGRVSGFILTAGLTGATAAHVHVAARGTPGPVIVPLTGGPELWVVPDSAAALSAAQISDFNAGRLYFNVHTSANPNGEIRGQIDKAGTTRFASLTGAQETPAVATAAFGHGVLALDEATGGVAGFVVASGLPTANAAHVHSAARGTPGGIVVPLTGAGNLWVVPDDAPPLAAEQRPHFGDDGLYYNVHTPANPSGEIRGQLDKTGDARVTALEGAQEVPAVTTSAFGAGLLALDDGTSGEIAGFLLTTGLTNPTAAHAHLAPRGVAGPIVVPLSGP